jgi:prepilin-type N-terminal cleavage/methylation domain-containing protein/prepilin-type processing-associated H-X9-DG protein
MESRIFSARVFPRTKGGFTLVELLVVIVIIGILAAVMFPVFGAAREKGRQATCLSNIRQLAMAMIMYASDHDGDFVPAMDAANLTRWHGARSSLSKPFDPSRGPLARFLVNWQIKECPTFARFSRGEGAFEQGTGGYGYNGQYVGGSPVGKWPDCLQPANETKIANPTETIMLTDAAFLDQDGNLIEYSFCEAPYWQAWGTKADPSTHFRHNGAASVAFCDGHVKAMKVGLVHASGWWLPEEDFRSNNFGFIGSDNSLYDRK